MVDILTLNKEKIQPIFTNPVILKIEESKQNNSIAYGGLALARDMINKLNITEKINNELKIFVRHKPYFESDHILTFVYNFLSGGEAIIDIERLQNDNGFKRLLGTDSIPAPTTAGDFLCRFRKENIIQLNNIFNGIRENAFKYHPKKMKNKVTIDADSSFHEVFGEKKEGADFSYTRKWCYHPLYFTNAETGEMVDVELRTGNVYSSLNTSKKLPSILEFYKNEESVKELNFRGDAAFYDKKIINICEEKGATFYITADQTKDIITEVLNINNWKSYKKGNKRNSSGRKKRKNLKKSRSIELRKRKGKKINIRGKSDIAEFYYNPKSWKKRYRYIVKRTEILDENGECYLNDGISNYVYHIIVTNSSKPINEVIKIAQKRGNQENLIKDFKYGLGLKHVPTGFFNANKVYFLISMLAWNIKTWMLNILKLGNGAKVRFKRFLYKNIYFVLTVSKTGKDMLQLKLNKGIDIVKIRNSFELIKKLE